jgi:hypothetical protein
MRAEEFADFYEFVKKIDRYGMKSGIVKIVPPKEWRNALPSVSQPLKETRIKDSICEHFLGSMGLFRQTNVSRSRIYNPKQWREMADSDKYATPDFFNKAPSRTETPAKRPARASTSSRKRKVAKVEEEADPVRDDARDGTPPLVDNHSTPSDSNDMPLTPRNDTAELVEERSMTPAAEPTVEAPVLPKMRKPVLTPNQRAEVTDEEWSTFNWTDMPHGALPFLLSLELPKDRMYRRHDGGLHG